MENCIFCKIINKQIPATFLYEDNNMIIINDINPIAPVHLLVIPKEHYARLEEQKPQQTAVLGQCLNKVDLLKDSLNLQDG